MCYHMQRVEMGREPHPHEQSDVAGTPSSRCSLVKLQATDRWGPWGVTDNQNEVGLPVMANRFNVQCVHSLLQKRKPRHRDVGQLPT